MGKAGSQGEGGPGEMELSVANATAAFEMVLSPGAGRTSAAGGNCPPLSLPQRQGEPVPPGFSPPPAKKLDNSPGSVLQ